MWDKPQEMSDTTPFAEDFRPRDYDPVLAAEWFRLLTGGSRTALPPADRRPRLVRGRTAVSGS